MSLTLISPRYRETVVTFSRNFDYIGENNWGFSFPCNEQGEVDVESLADSGRANYLACLDPTNPLGVEDKGVRRYEHSYIVPAEGRCQCGNTVVLDGDYHGEGIDCDRCGRIYNLVGQELAPRAQWED